MARSSRSEVGKKTLSRSSMEVRASVVLLELFGISVAPVASPLLDRSKGYELIVSLQDSVGLKH